MKKEKCEKCNRYISKCNFKKHFNVCDGTYFIGSVNPNKRKSKLSPEELKNIRVKNIEKARQHRKNIAWNKGTFLYTDEEVFVLGKKFNCVKRMFLTKVEYKCSKCNVSEWNSVPIVLELDHVNGNNLDNRLENLRLLCPNCHSQTITYKNKNGNGVKKVSDQHIISAINNCENIRQVLLKVGLQDQGANYRRVNKIIIKYNITPSWKDLPL